MFSVRRTFASVVRDLSIGLSDGSIELDPVEETEIAAELQSEIRRQFRLAGAGDAISGDRLSQLVQTLASTMDRDFREIREIRRLLGLLGMRRPGTECEIRTLAQEYSSLADVRPILAELEIARLRRPELAPELELELEWAISTILELRLLDIVESKRGLDVRSSIRMAMLTAGAPEGVPQLVRDAVENTVTRIVGALLDEARAVRGVVARALDRNQPPHRMHYDQIEKDLRSGRGSSLGE